MSSSAITGPVLSDTRRASSGTAAAPSFAFNASTGTGVYLVSSDVLGLSTAGVQRVVVDASGNVGVGTGSPANYGTTNTTTLTAFRSDQNITLGAYWQSGVGQYSFINSGTTNNASASALVLQTGGTERMRIDASGNLLVGATSSVTGTGASISTAGRNVGCTLSVQAHNGAGFDPLLYLEAPGVSGSYIWTSRANSQLRLSSGSQTNGVSLAASGTSWGSFSDERLKTDLVPIEDAAYKITQLRAVIGRYKTDSEEKRRPFLIAQDVQKVLPEAVYQNSEDDDTLSLAYTEVVPLLVAAVKEQQEIIGKLEARLAALEAK